MAFDIDPNREVLYDGNVTQLRYVPADGEFTCDGKHYATRIQNARFQDVPEGGHFCDGRIWFVREGKGASRPTDMNLPFTAPWGPHVRRFMNSMHVQLVIIEALDDLK